MKTKKNITKRLLPILGITLVMMSACEKEASIAKFTGKYNPDVKIDRVYTSIIETSETGQSYTIPMYISQRWIWNNNQLMQVVYYSYNDSTNTTSEQFAYDVNGLLQSITSTDDMRTLFYYQNDRLTTMEFIYTPYNELYCKVDFNYDNTTLNNYVITQYPVSNGNKSKKIVARALSQIMPQPLDKLIAKSIQKNSGAKTLDTISNQIQLTWTNQNVTSFTLTNSSNPNNSEQYLFTFDNKSNPLQNCFGHPVAFINNAEFSALSHNNITSIVRDSYGSQDTLITTTYQYSGNYPIEAVSHYSVAPYQSSNPYTVIKQIMYQ